MTTTYEFFERILEQLNEAQTRLNAIYATIKEYLHEEQRGVERSR